MLPDCLVNTKLSNQTLPSTPLLPHNMLPNCLVNRQLSNQTSPDFPPLPHSASSTNDEFNIRTHNKTSNIRPTITNTLHHPTINMIQDTSNTSHKNNEHHHQHSIY